MRVQRLNDEHTAYTQCARNTMTMGGDKRFPPFPLPVARREGDGHGRSGKP